MRMQAMILAGVAGLVVSAAPPPPAPSMGLCHADETVLFSCGIAARTVSVCSGNHPAAHVQYRFGTAAKPELTYPATPNGHGTMVYASAAYSGGGEAQLRFASGGFDYAVFSRVVRNGPRSSSAEAGLVVRKGDRIVSQKSCNNQKTAMVDLDAAMKVLPQGEQLDTQ